MRILNKASFPVVAFGWHKQFGYGEDVTILPGQVAEVNGPFVGEMGGGECDILIEGALICHEAPDDDHALQISVGMPIVFAGEEVGVTVRHHSEEPEVFVVAWREAQRFET